MAQALTFASDFKLGHYMKIPPRSMFWSQVVATVIAGTVQLGVQAWMFTNIPDMCSPTQKNGFICPSTEVFGTASVIWGVIGPARQFSRGQIYGNLSYFFLIGFLAPVCGYLISLKFPNSWFRYIKCVSLCSRAAFYLTNIIASLLFSPALVSFLPPRLSTTFRGVLSGSSSSM